MTISADETAATGPWWMPKEALQALFDALQGSGYTIVGPTRVDEAIVYEELNSPDQLPRGWTDQQSAGQYRTVRSKNANYFEFNVGPQSWKQYLFPPRVTVQNGSEASVSDGSMRPFVTALQKIKVDDSVVVRKTLERKLQAVFGKDWGRLNQQFKILYGGIDTKEVTERIASPSGAMGAIQRMMANEMACRATAADFARVPEERLLFPHVDASAIPGLDDASIEANILYLHERVLGETITADDPRYADTLFLFESVYEDGLSGIAAGEYPATLIAPCRQSTHPETGDPLEVPIVDDPDYTVRAWMAVVSAMLGDFQFIYE